MDSAGNKKVKKFVRPILTYADEAHQLPEAARQMYGKTLGNDEIKEICSNLEKEHQKKEAGRVQETFRSLFESLEDSIGNGAAGEEGPSLPEMDVKQFKTAITQLEQIMENLRGTVPRWTLNRLGEAMEVLGLFYKKDPNYILYLQHDREHLPVLCATSRRVPKLLQESLWCQGFPAILTSGTLKAGNGFARTRQVTGLSTTDNVQEYVAKSPFEY